MMKKNHNYQVIFLLVVVLMRIASAPTANLSYLLLAGYALTGRVQTIQALTLSWLITMLSPGIAAEASMASVGRYVVILGAALSAFLHSGILLNRRSVRWPVLSTLMLGIFFIVHALFFSPMVDVSILKAASWMTVMVVLISSWFGLSGAERNTLVLQIFGGLVVVMLISLPLLLHPLGYLRNGTGFQGILNHPQAFGSTMALLGAWAASQMFTQIRPKWAMVMLVGICVALVLLSEARTAGMALVLAVGSAVVTAPLLSGQSLRRVLPGLRSERVWLVFAVLLVLGIVMAPTLAGTLQNYISKSGRAGQMGSVVQAYENSRGRLIGRMSTNIGEHPFTGIGFGIASSPYEMVVKRDPLLGLPMSASIEKGVMPLALVEELGIVGFLLVGAWLWMLLRQSAFGGVTPLAVVCTVLLLNLGESTFFSTGGMGLLSLILICWAYVSGQKRLTG